MLYSNDSRKQFVQRRGRALRKYSKKEYAVIYDMLLLPFGLDLPVTRIEAILDKEMKRYREFASLSINPGECQKILDDAYQKALGGAYV
jgi:superfamily II DNA or RNA helicase